MWPEPALSKKPVSEKRTSQELALSLWGCREANFTLMSDSGMVLLLSLGLSRFMLDLSAVAIRAWAVWSVMAMNEARPS
jgi:hypothetical protein